MSKRIERYEGRSAEDLNAKRCCAFCGGLLGAETSPNFFERMYSNTAGLWFDRQSCRTQFNKAKAEGDFDERYSDICKSLAFFV